MDDEDKIEPRDIGRIAYEAAAKATGCEQPWAEANQAKWNAAAMAVLAWACHELDEEAEYGCPCNEDERVAWELTDKLRELGGLPRRDSVTANVEVQVQDEAQLRTVPLERPVGRKEDGK